MAHLSEEAIKEEYQIVRRAQENPEVFGFLYEKYYKTIFIFISKRVEDRTTTADLTSQVFLKALLNLPKYQFKGLPFSAWLLRIATNQVNEFYRGTNKERFLSIEQADIEQLFEQTDNHKNEDLERLTVLLSNLEPQEMQLIELRFFEELPFKEVAFILDISENLAKVRTYRLLEKLRQQIKH